MRTRLPIAFATLLLGCSDPADPACRVGADCASGVCTSAGQCLTADDATDGFAPDSEGLPDATDPPDLGQDDTNEADLGEEDSAGEPDVLTFPDVPIDPDAVVATCTPNHDFVIARSEAPFPLGASVTYRSASAAENDGKLIPVDLEGYIDGEGFRHWTLKGDLPTDAPMVVTTEPVTENRWFADSFPGASYTARLSIDYPLLGVFETTPDALLLRGVVSPVDGNFATKLVYETPVVVLSFPVHEGDTWSTKTAISGSAEGVPCLAGTCTEDYANEVDAHGVLDTPFGTFRVLRIRVELNRRVGFGVTTTRTFLFVAECFATVGTAVSKTNETAIEFTEAAEVRRIAPP